ncbi:interferon gamma-like [Archocentrus centrarchus]|uniref:interferon gamma-like n=1 Tax=Archocentrus centrarchus TaxID=63155 RepID=UPI0011EA381A|nr:interferon gamma-like [Archocentrus centrarchus]
MATTVRAAVCLCLWLFACQVRGSHIPQEMNRTIQSLLQHYKISNKERFDGKPVFPNEQLSGKMETKLVFMGGVLDSYEKLFGHMLKQLPTPSPQIAGSNAQPGSAVTAASSDPSNAGSAAGRDVRSQLKYILRKVQELKRHRYQEQEKLLQGLQTLRHIKMDDHIVQSKALWQLPQLYEEASSLPEIKMQRRRRRRRQTKAKGHQRG